MEQSPDSSMNNTRPANLRGLLLRLWQWVEQHRWVAFALFAAGVGLNVFTEVAEELLENELLPVDLSIMRVVRPYQGAAPDLLARALSDAIVWPYVIALVLPFVLYLAITRRWRVALGVMVFPLATLAVVYILKALFGRERPLTAAVAEFGQSFPSGHATLAVVIYGLLGYVAWKFWVHARWGRWLIVLLVIILIILTGLARVYLEVHYPSDVLAGWAAGLFLLSGSLVLLEHCDRQQKEC